MNDFGMTPDRIRQIRAKYGLTQEKFAQKLGVAHLTIYRWENGRNTPMPVLREKLEEIENEYVNNL